MRLRTYKTSKKKRRKKRKKPVYEDYAGKVKKLERRLRLSKNEIRNFPVMLAGVAAVTVAVSSVLAMITAPETGGYFLLFLLYGAGAAGVAAAVKFLKGMKRASMIMGIASLELVYCTISFVSDNFFAFGEIFKNLQMLDKLAGVVLYLSMPAVFAAVITRTHFATDTLIRKIILATAPAGSIAALFSGMMFMTSVWNFPVFNEFMIYVCICGFAYFGGLLMLNVFALLSVFHTKGYKAKSMASASRASGFILGCSLLGWIVVLVGIFSSFYAVFNMPDSGQQLFFFLTALLTVVVPMFIVAGAFVDFFNQLAYREWSRKARIRIFQLKREMKGLREAGLGPKTGHAAI